VIPPEAGGEFVDWPQEIDFIYTPKHGSWLNVAECELSCMTSRCLMGRRIGELDKLQKEMAAWSTRVDRKQRGVDWQFTVAKARVRLKQLYSTFLTGHGTRFCHWTTTWTESPSAFPTSGK
jgi:hypothetical protein